MAGFGNLIFNKWSMLAILFLIIWISGGGNFIFKNPIIIVFIVLLLIVGSMGGKK